MKDRRLTKLNFVYNALKEKSYSPIGQIAGYILTGDPAYITNHKGARQVVTEIDRYELLKDMLLEYFQKEIAKGEIHFNAEGRSSMRGKTAKKVQTGNEGAEIKKRPGRQPMTPEQKEAAAKLRAAEKAKAENLKPELILQFQENDVNIAELVEAAKADFHKAKKRTFVTDMKLYIKLEDRAAYYVINGDQQGKVAF